MPNKCSTTIQILKTLLEKGNTSLMYQPEGWLQIVCEHPIWEDRLLITATEWKRSSGPGSVSLVCNGQDP